MSRPGLTLLTVSLNCREHFLHTAGSLPAALPPWLHWVVVDGGSTDGTAEAMAADPRVGQGSSEPDGGIYDAYNKAWQRAPTDRVLYLNCGDRLVPEALSLLEPCAIGPGRGDDRVVHCFAVTMEANGHRTWVPDPAQLHGGMTVPTPGVLFPRAALAEAGGFSTSLRVASDYEVLLGMRQRGWTFQPHAQVLTRYLGGGFSERLAHLAFFEECLIQMRSGAVTGDQVLLRAARRAVADLDPQTVEYRRWRLALTLGKRFLY